MFDEEKVVPSLIVAFGAHPEGGWTMDRVRRVVDGGVDGILLRIGGVGREEGRRGVLDLVEACGGRAPVLLDGDLRAAAELGLGVVLPERGLATAEARRRLGDRSSIGRRVGSISAAAAAAGADFLVTEPLPARDESGAEGIGLVGLRRIVETAWVPVLAAVGIEERWVAEAIGAGAHGVIVGGGLLEAEPERAAGRLRAVVGRDPGGSDREAATAVGRVEASGAGGDDAVTVELNGERTIVPAGTTVDDLVGERGWRSEAVVVTINRRRLARRRFDGVVLGDGDTVEVVQIDGADENSESVS